MLRHIRMKPQSHSFLHKFGLQYPIVQAPMAGASTTELAATITKLGGLGSLPLGSHSESPEIVEETMTKFVRFVGEEKAKTVNFNFFTHDVPKRDGSKEQKWLKKYKTYYTQAGIPSDGGLKEMNLMYPTFKSITDPSHKTVQMLVSLLPKVVSFHFGLPHSNVIKALQDAGISVFVSATSVEEFQQCCDSNVDCVVLQGWDAGGHRGGFIANDPDDLKLNTEVLINEVINFIDDTSITDPPFLVAAGGIHSSSQIKTLLSKGIAGVQLGTVWLPTTQCTISPTHLKYIQHPGNASTIMSPSISGRNLRTVSTPFLQTLTDTPVGDIPDYPLPYDTFKNFAKVSKNTEYSAYLAGSGFDKSWKGTRHTEEVFEDLIKGL